MIGDRTHETAMVDASIGEANTGQRMEPPVESGWSDALQLVPTATLWPPFLPAS